VGIVVLTIRFLCELGALVAVGWWGYHVHLALAIVLPLVVGIVWGLFVAPRAKTRLRDPWRFLVESLVWIGATAALVTIVWLATPFGVLAFVTAVLARRYEPGVTESVSRQEGQQ
jgi:hypothetical protein